LQPAKKYPAETQNSPRRRKKRKRIPFHYGERKIQPFYAKLSPARFYFAAEISLI
jgi:hypothetical protein